MEICVEAARSCARIAEIQIQRGLSKVPIVIHAAPICAGMLLVEIWDLKAQEKLQQLGSLEDVKPTSVHRIELLMADVKIFVGVLERAKPRWPFVSSFL